MKAIIVDDERAARNILRNLVELFFPEIEIVSMESNLPDAVLSIKELKPDIVFLDIEMPNYVGYEIVKFISDIDFHIIFVTAYDKYAIRAFEMNAVDYILKPIERERLKVAIEKVKYRMGHDVIKINYHQLLEEIEKETTKFITISEQNKNHVILIKNIIAVEAQGAYSLLFRKDKPKLIISKNIGYFEALLKDEIRFFRSHKSWLINTNTIVEYSIGEATISLENDIIAKLSRPKKKDFNKLVSFK